MNKNLIRGGIALAVIGVIMALTNPQPDAYSEYATERLFNTGEKLICDKTGYCDLENTPITIKRLIKQNTLKPLISSATQRQNLGILSIYTTEVPEVTTIKTLGIFGKFFTFSQTNSLK